MVLTGAVAGGAVLGLAFTVRRWYTPVVEVVGLIAALAFLGVGLRWSFDVLRDVYGD